MKFRSRTKTNSVVAAALWFVLLAAVSPALAGEAEVVTAAATPDSTGAWRIDATIRHADEGWEHYANAFEVLGPQGRILAVRVLVHPHVEEQPFTRSLGDVAIPPGTDFIVIRARDSVHEYGGSEFRIDLPAQ
uniref:hypothetical protein n=1 Tax=Pararhizobium sp. IMCC3301 TaxID=3067904 RepID=UPI0027427B39|nr:hypothetical protein [Pararhizobium sp. IMCC3301]